jgi:hypothetical protein
MHINNYVPRGSGLIEEHKGSPYVPRLADVHKLCTSVFKLRNIFLNMNISPEEHKKLRNKCLFL